MLGKQEKGDGAERSSEVKEERRKNLSSPEKLFLHALSIPLEEIRDVSPGMMSQRRQRAHTVLEFDASKLVEEGKRIILFGEDFQYLVSMEHVEQIVRSLRLASLKTTIWFDFQGLSNEEILSLAKVFDFHVLTAEDITEKDVREKTEVFDNYRCVVIQEEHYQTGSNYTETVPINILIFHYYVLSFHSDPVNSLYEVFLGVNKIVSSTVPPTMPPPDWVMYSFFNSVTDMYISLVDSCVGEVTALDNMVLILTSEEQDDLLRRIGLARRRIGELRSTLWVKKEILHHLISSDAPFIRTRTSVYLRDVQDEVSRLLQKLDDLNYKVANLTNTYLARVSIEVAQASNRMNDLMKKFAAISAIFLPLTLVAGLWGMNVSVPGQSDTHPNLHWFIGIVVSIGVAIIFMLAFFRYIRWL